MTQARLHGGTVCWKEGQHSMLQHKAVAAGGVTGRSRAARQQDHDEGFARAILRLSQRP